MAYDPTAAAGSKLYISATPSGGATTEVFGVKTLDAVELGERTPIDLTTIRDTSEQWDVSGMVKSSTIRLQGFLAAGATVDAGQALMKVARTAGVSYNFKLTLTDGASTPTTYTFAAFVTKYAVDVQDGKDNIVMFTSELKITGAVTEVAAT